MHLTNTSQLFGLIVLCLFINPVIANGNSQPVIQVVKPLSRPISSPFNVDINFFSPKGSSIKPETLKVYYGWLNIDVTEQIMQYAVIDHFGINAKNIQLPPGEHHFTLEIQDTRNRQFRQEIYIQIIDNPVQKSTLSINASASRHIAGLDRH